MKKQAILLCLALASAFSVFEVGAAVRTDGTDKAKSEKSESKTELNDYQKLFDKKKCETAKGLVTIHKIDGKQILFEFPTKILGRDMMLGSTVSEISNNEHSVIGFKSKQPLHIKFEKQNNRINLVTVNDLYTTEQENIKKAVAKSTIGGIFKSFKIAAWSPDSASVVFDATPLFMSHIVDIDPFDPGAGFGSKPYNRSVSFEKDKSQLGAIKSFSDNFSVSSCLTYSSTVTYSNGKMSGAVETKAPVTAVVNRSFLLLPEEPMRPRLADPRMAIFPTGKAKFTTNDIRGTLPEYYARKWNLEPVDMEAWKRGELVETTRQIVFYIDDAFPENWRGPIKEAVEMWNEAFEQMGFKNVMKARMFPTKEEDPEFDPDNLKYSCLRYQPIPIQNAMGPSWFDPRSGEIFTASVMVYHDVINLVSKWLFVQTAAANPRVRNGEIPQDIMDDALRYVIGHEVGHCLSLMHNMAASSAIPVEKLRDPEFTQKYGTTYSIMDYARFNYVAQPGDMERGVKLTPPRIGLADYFSIKWLYSPIPEAETYQEEKPVLDEWIREKSDDPRYRYGKQQVFVTLDPSSQTEDLGDDAVKASEYGVKNLKYIMKNMNSWLKDNDPDLTKREQLYRAVLNQYFMYLYHVYNVKGGIYLNERCQGDARPSFEFVEASYQRRAQKFLCDQLNDLDWLEPEDLLQEIPLMGNQSVKIQNNLMAFIMADRGSLDAYRHKEFTISESHDIIIDAIFGKTRKGKSLNNRDMTNQNTYLNMLFMLSQLDKSNNSTNKMGLADLENSPFASGICPEYDQVTPEDIMGFSFYRGLSASMSPKYHIYYSKIIEIRDLLEKKRHTGNKDTQAHYELLLHKINGLLL